MVLPLLTVVDRIWGGCCLPVQFYQTPAGPLSYSLTVITVQNSYNSVSLQIAQGFICRRGKEVFQEGLIVAIVWTQAESKLARSLDCPGHCFSMISWKAICCNRKDSFSLKKRDKKH